MLFNNSGSSSRKLVWVDLGDISRGGAALSALGSSTHLDRQSASSLEENQAKFRAPIQSRVCKPRLRRTSLGLRGRLLHRKSSASWWRSWIAARLSCRSRCELCRKFLHCRLNRSSRKQGWGAFLSPLSNVRFRYQTRVFSSSTCTQTLIKKPPPRSRRANRSKNLGSPLSHERACCDRRPIQDAEGDDPGNATCKSLWRASHAGKIQSRRPYLGKPPLRNTEQESPC